VIENPGYEAVSDPGIQQAMEALLLFGGTEVSVFLVELLRAMGLEVLSKQAGAVVCRIKCHAHA